MFPLATVMAVDVITLLYILLLQTVLLDYLNVIFLKFMDKCKVNEQLQSNRLLHV